MCEPIRFANCDNNCNDPFITSNTPSLAPQLTDCSSSASSSYSRSCYRPSKGRKQSKCYTNDSVICFKAMMINLKDVTTNGQTNNTVKFDIRKKNGVVVIQWEPFTATTAINQAGYFSVGQGLTNMPEYQVNGDFLIKVGNDWRRATVAVDPNGGNQIRFYYTADMNGTVSVDTAIQVPGGTMQWITNC